MSNILQIKRPSLIPALAALSGHLLVLVVDLPEELRRLFLMPSH